MYLLDTNIVSELRKAGSKSESKSLIKWARSVPLNTMFISAITILELEIGVLRKERKDPRQGALLRAWLEHHVLKTFSDNTLPIDIVVAQRCAKLHVPDQRSDRDALIASTALVHGMTIVTRNEKDFCISGLEVLNPF